MLKEYYLDGDENAEVNLGAEHDLEEDNQSDNQLSEYRLEHMQQIGVGLSHDINRLETGLSEVDSDDDEEIQTLTESLTHFPAEDLKKNI